MPTSLSRAVGWREVHEAGRGGIERRALEAYAVGRWADLRRDDAHAFA